MVRTIYAGIDESNHGKFPEVYAIAFSNIPSDTLEALTDIPKLRKKQKRTSVFAKFNSSRDYSFLLLDNFYYKQIKKQFHPGLITASLMGENFAKNLDAELRLFIDGETSRTQITNTKSILEEICGFDKRQIHIKAGPNFDKIYPIVNLADQVAYQLYKTPLENLSQNSKRKEILYKYFPFYTKTF